MRSKTTVSFNGSSWKAPPVEGAAGDGAKLVRWWSREVSRTRFSSPLVTLVDTYDRHRHQAQFLRALPSLSIKSAHPQLWHRKSSTSSALSTPVASSTP